MIEMRLWWWRSSKQIILLHSYFDCVICIDFWKLMCFVAMLWLWCDEPHMGQCNVWSFSLHWLFGSSPLTRCSHNLYSVDAVRYKLELASVTCHASRWKCSSSKLAVLSFSRNGLVYLLGFCGWFQTLYGFRFDLIHSTCLCDWILT